ncbi:hypothetical protein SDC9_162144 [bioreactor metagenome]|uniref:FRG domain-containing protein n=1 Tax=bioreactor metagenome TaxID=1076179 RepID=A0A645FK97_9ZZZZ
MQHYLGNTRLLDFTKDPKVALRFACGSEGDNCRKKVTLYNTSYIKSDDLEQKEVLDTFISLIESDKKIPKLYGSQLKYLKKDYFVEVPLDFPRIKRQDGLFLLMGNFTTADLINREPKDHKEKVKHELSPTVGRGDEYEGYVGVLSVSPHSVAQIRNELEQTVSYQMDYLMAEDENVNFNFMTTHPQHRPLWWRQLFQRNFDHY